MVLPESGPLTIEDIADEFGGSKPHRLSEYYNGGAYVPSGTEGLNGLIPSSGNIRISDFYGAPLAGNQEVNFVFTAGASNNDVGIYDYPAYPRGYTSVWANGEHSYGVFESGSVWSDEGWGINSVTAFQEYSNSSNHQKGWVINFGDTSYGGSKFKFEVNTPRNGLVTLYSSNANSDNNVTVNYSGGTKQVRSLYFYLGTHPEYNVPFVSGETVSVKVTRVS